MCRASTRWWRSRRFCGASWLGRRSVCPWCVRTDILSSTRNRGTAHGEPLAAHRELRDHGITPGEVAGLAVRSIRDGRFYVHTHPDLISAAVTERCADILAPPP